MKTINNPLRNNLTEIIKLTPESYSQEIIKYTEDTCMIIWNKMMNPHGYLRSKIRFPAFTEFHYINYEFTIDQ